MNRTRASWSNFTDIIEGECMVCGAAVRYVIPGDRPDPALLYHATCDPTPILRKRLKGFTPPLLPVEFTIKKVEVAPGGEGPSPVPPAAVVVPPTAPPTA